MATSGDATRLRPALFGGLALLVAVGTGLGTWSVVSGYQHRLDEAKRPAGTTDVVTATHDLDVGLILTEADLTTTRLAVADAPVDATFRSADELVGQATLERILAGEPIRRERLTLGAGLPVPETMLAPGTRAITVKVDREAGVAGFVRPGSYVDVIVTVRPDENALGANWVTETILQAVRVIAIGDATVPPPAPKEPPTARKADTTRPRDVFATLEVEPSEAEKVAMAASRGDLYLSLRPLDDFALADVGSPLVTNSLVGLDNRPAPERIVRLQKLAAARPAPAAPPSPTAEVINGPNTKVETFGADGQPTRTPSRK